MTGDLIPWAAAIAPLALVSVRLAARIRRDGYGDLPAPRSHEPWWAGTSAPDFR